MLQITITTVAIAAAIIHLVWPDLTIDAITITFIVIAIFPWLRPLIKSFELPGGWKIEYQDIQNVRTKAEKVGLLNPQMRGSGGTPTYLFSLSEEEDPILIFSGLRLEIESHIRQLARGSITQGIVWAEPAGSTSDIINILKMKNILNSEEGNVLKDIIRILDSGLHGADIDKQAIEWALDIGPRIVGVLVDKQGELIRKTNQSLKPVPPPRG